MNSQSLTKPATASGGSPLSCDISRVPFHLASCQSYGIWILIPLCQGESRGSERQRDFLITHDLQMAQIGLWFRRPSGPSLLPASICLPETREQQRLPLRAQTPLFSPILSSVCLSLPVSSCPGPPQFDSGQSPHPHPWIRSPLMGWSPLLLPPPCSLVRSLIRNLPSSWGHLQINHKTGKSQGLYLDKDQRTQTSDIRSYLCPLILSFSLKKREKFEFHDT